jgi:hypothetical protein
MTIDFAAPLKPKKKKKGKLVIVEAPPPAPPELLNLESVREALSPYLVQVDGMKQEAAALQITDEASNTRAVELGNQARKIKKAIEAIKQDTPYVKAKEFINGVGNLIKSFVEPLDGQVERVLKGKISAYQEQMRLEQQRREAAAREAARIQQAKIEAEARAIREEAERKAREAEALLRKEKDEAARLALQKTIEDERAAANAPAPQVVAPVVEQVQNVTRTGAGSAFQRKRWVCRIINPAEIPREYCAPNQVMLNEAVKAGIRAIPGCEIVEVTETSFKG